MLSATVGQHVNFSIGFLDQNGNPMLRTPAVAVPPTWTNLVLDHLIPAPDGLTCQADAVGPGNDTITVQVTVGNTFYTAKLSAVVNVKG